MVIKFGLMVQDTKDIGEMIKQMALENWFMLMEMFMRESGLMIKLMGKEPILMLMEHTIMETGLMINNTDLEWNPGLMEQNTKVGLRMEGKMERES